MIEPDSTVEALPLVHVSIKDMPKAQVHQVGLRLGVR
jgi:hypothetical protein